MNRIWLHHFGRGLVPTPSDFGISGQPPSHPELLDWLADDFVRHGWDQKRLHRMILLSRAYQQASRRTPELDRIDPENVLLARMNIRRLEAESIRDSILSIAGSMNSKIGGASENVTLDPEGKVVLGKRKIKDGLKAGVDSSSVNGSRRSIYIEVQRDLPLNMLATFDQPRMNPNCSLRRHSTVSTQALWFMNDNEIIEQSEKLAKSLMQIDSPAQRIKTVFKLILSSDPSPDEIKDCEQYLQTQTQFFQQSKSKVKKINPAEHALATLCQTLFASNRFLYVD